MLGPSCFSHSSAPGNTRTHVCIHTVDSRVAEMYRKMEFLQGTLRIPSEVAIRITSLMYIYEVGMLAESEDTRE